MVDGRVSALFSPKQNIFFLGCKPFFFFFVIIIEAHELPSYLVELCVVTQSTYKLSHGSLANDEAICKPSAVSKTTETDHVEFNKTIRLGEHKTLSGIHTLTCMPRGIAYKHRHKKTEEREDVIF